MKRSILLGLLALVMGGQAMAADIKGAGSSFAAPLYEAWIFSSHNVDRIEYQGVGSGEGIKRAAAKTVDFGASDAPLSAAELDAKGLLQFPTAVAALVPVVNLPGVYSGQLNLSGEVLAGIYSGTITKWNDPKIAELNPLIKFPAKAIVALHREDESGSSYVLTDYLSKVSPDWKAKVGQGLSVKWPAGSGVKGGKAMMEAVKAKEGAIGYVEYALAVSKNLTYTRMKNSDGTFVKPTTDSVQAAMDKAQWNATSGFAGASLTNSAGSLSWPLTSATFVLLPKVTHNASNTQQVMAMMDWGFRHGFIVSKGLGFVPVPKSLHEQIHSNWTSVRDALGLQVYGK
jgi:phosphate transport system substrate-binding protein